MFVNFSNHYSNKWTGKQLVAASEYGEIIDYPFPSVEPDWSDDRISEVIEKCVKDIADLKPDRVMCQGEFVVTHGVVNGLMAKGIVCVASCSKRVSEEVIMPDGSIIKESVFQLNVSENTRNDLSLKNEEGGEGNIVQCMTDKEGLEKAYNVDYPRKEDNGDIFAWFTGNHKAYKFNKKTNSTIIDNMPNKRTGMFFAEYMEAMEPCLKSTDYEKKLNIKVEDNRKECIESNKSQSYTGNRKTYATASIINKVVSAVIEVDDWGNVRLKPSKDIPQFSSLTKKYTKMKKYVSGDTINVMFDIDLTDRNNRVIHCYKPV